MAAPPKNVGSASTTWLVAGLGALLLTARVWADPTGRMLGYVSSEGPSHLWLQWAFDTRSGPSLFTYDGVMVGEPVTLAFTDAATHLAVWVLDRVLDRVLAYNLVVMAWVAVGAASIGAIVRRLGGSTPVVILATLVPVTEPALRGFASAGRYDSMAVVSVVAAAWALLAAVQDPRPWRMGVLGVLAGLVAWAGPNAAVVGAIVLLPLGLVALWRCPERGRLLGAVGLAAGVAAPWLWIFLHAGAETGDRFSDTHTALPLWEIVSRETLSLRRATYYFAQTLDHTGVASQWRWPDAVRALQEAKGSQIAICGRSLTGGPEGILLGVPLVAALLLIVRRPLIGVPALGGLLALAFLSTGHGAVHSRGFVLPDGNVLIIAAWGLLGGLPGLSIFRNFGLFAVLAGAVGALLCALGPRSTWQRVLLLAALGAEGMGRSSLVWPAAATEVRPPAGLLSALAGGSGAVLVLPHGLYVPNTLQAFHGRPSLDPFNAPKGCYARPMFATLFYNDLEAGMLQQGSVSALARNGVEDIVLFPEAMHPTFAALVERQLRARLGEPDTGPGWARWHLTPDG